MCFIFVIMLCIGTTEIHKPTVDTINPAYHTVTENYKAEPEEESISYYEEVNRSRPLDVKMTQNPAYAVP